MNNKGGGELHEIKQSETKEKTNMIKNKQINKYLLKSLTHEIVLRHEK